MGFVSGVQPRISYNYGSKNEEQITKLIKYSLILNLVFGIITFIGSRSMSELLITIFTPKNTNLFNISLNAFMLFSISFIFNGVNIFASGMFTAFSNGKVSAIISSLRTFVLFIVGIVILPNFLGVDGVWLVVPFAEVLYMYESMFKKKVLNNIEVENI